MNMTIHCPGCEISLHVPQQAAGRTARCPKCRRKFIVPSANELLEETVSHWIFKDLEHDDDERAQRTGDTLMGVVADHPPRRAAENAPSHEEGGSATATQDPPRDEASAPDAPASETDDPVVEGAASTSDATEAAEEDLSPDDLARVETAAPPPLERPVAATPPPPPPAPTKSPYPQDLQSAEPQPHLVVRDCSQSGVVLAFEPRWLEHEGFRASMPVRCAFSGVSTRGELVARPMVFLERYRGADRAPHLIEARHERHLVAQQSTRDLIKAMGHIDNMIPPFQNVCVYYASKHHAGQSLYCHTAMLGEAQVCEVTIPDGRVALEWLGRVNGVCGEAYDLLRSDVAMLGSDAWRALTERCRERLGSWCRFQPREQFRIYINDADFGSHDSGLAGVVITDSRIIYHKYHHGGSIDLDDEATLHVKTDGTLARLTYDAKGQLARIGKIHIKDMSRLIETLADAPKLRIQLGASSRS